MARINLAFTLIFCATFYARTAGSTTISPSVKDFFPDIDGNLTKVTWAHAVNSKEDLENALASSEIMMLEADIVLGTLNDSTSKEIIPIMGHPPANTSDLSLEDFLNTVLNDTKRGVKLDFKTIEVFNASKSILAKVRDNMKFPVWLNADILQGPVEATGTPVDAKKFLTGAAETFPQSTLSIGWTTRYGTEPNITDGSYSADNIAAMLDVVKSNNVTQPLTYPVRAGMAANSLTELQNLISGSPNGSTLTIWSHDGDEVDGDKLSDLILKVGVDKVYVDVPDDVWQEINLDSGASGMKMGAMAFGAMLAAVILIRLF